MFHTKVENGFGIVRLLIGNLSQKPGKLNILKYDIIFKFRKQLCEPELGAKFDRPRYCQ